jgi:hypothetical protein
LQQDLDEKFYGEPVELIDGKTREDGREIVSPIVERTPSFQLRIVQGVVADILRPVYM